MTIQFDGVPNFRDMGGYRTHDGRQVKPGLFYRSAALGKMTPADKAKFSALGIKTIFDYRDDEEAMKNPDPSFEDITNIRVPAKLNALAQMPNEEKKANQFYKQVTPEMFKSLYTQMAFDNPSFQQLMTVAQNPNKLGLLHHCAIGKDRTGIGGAMILLALDVPRETIFEDYLKTNALLQATVEQIANKVRITSTESEMTQFYALMQAREDYLQAVFDGIDTRYSSVDDFLAEQFGLTKEKRMKMQAFSLD
ncbi:MAG TPA: tyrosine-protein phosphatase [Metalysinibacillus jejuensis]|uniref:Tyrosine-protein phosphatase n=1 Tax=Metalysinibacillus jejuensis TaxID=914327 RepID=A0A921NCB0_9BACL|nr:tyrosine-protein phosphatase [Metalysinibacillus jejuensis]HJH11265.1 tyrosine-protein phosphatase [Metalysinibacillus jejuensis]